MMGLLYSLGWYLDYLYVHSTRQEYLHLLYIASVLLVNLPGCAPSTCPNIHIKPSPDDQSWQCIPRCGRGLYCRDGRCRHCGDCPDPYTLAAEGHKEMFLIGECYYGSCPKSCGNGHISLPIANFSLCDLDCFDVIPPTPVPIAIKATCREGCNHGNCENAGECNCEEGWEGELCDQCSPDCVNGHCNSTSGQCLCLQGWGGTVCDQDISFCANNQPCKNEGTCINTEAGGYICQCLEDFEGTYCETEIEVKQHTCGSETCQQNETCVVIGEPGVFKCQCKKGFTGVNCAPSIKDNSLPAWVYAISVAVGVLIVCVLLVSYLCRKSCISLKWLVRRARKDNNDVTLLPAKLMYELNGNTLILKDLHNWTSCTLDTCKCVPGFPVTITAEMGDYPVSNLLPGLAYNFEIFRQPSDDIEDNGSGSLAEVEVYIPESHEQQNVCMGKLEEIQNTPFCRSLDEVLGSNSELRRYISNYYRDHLMDFQKDIIERSTDECADQICLILSTQVDLDTSIEPLLSRIASDKPEGAQEFVRILTEYHPTCRVCCCVRHRLHGGTCTEPQMAQQQSIEVSMDDSSNSTQV